MEAVLNHEYPQPNEEKLFEEMIKITVNRMKPQLGYIRRGQHAKATGCVRGLFTIRNFVDNDLRHGIFRHPNHTYPAIVRFSNASENLASDCKGDARGMAIKLLNLEGPSDTKVIENQFQDFLMINHPVFPFATPVEFIKLFQIRETPLIGDQLAIAWQALFHLHHLQIGTEILGKIVSNPLEMTYWSCTPYWLGPPGNIGGHAVKYSMVPILESMPMPTDLNHMPENYLSQSLARHLIVKEAVFEFKVQLQTNPIKMPVEDASVEWDEKDSAPITLATLTIPVQDVASSEGLALSKECELLSFSPWNALAEHRPMGGINRMRKAVYKASYADRIANILP